MLSSLCMKKRRAFNTIIKCSNGWTQDIRGKIKWRIQPLKDNKYLKIKIIYRRNFEEKKNHLHESFLSFCKAFYKFL